MAGDAWLVKAVGNNINLPKAVTLGRAYSGNRVPPSTVQKK